MIDKSNKILMQMPNAAAEDIWLPRKSNRESYHHHVPPDVVPQYKDKVDWNTIPRGVSGKRKSLRRSPHYENVVIGVKPKDYIELTKTVKNSLILSEKEELQAPEESTPTFFERPPLHTTYKMPPLTPTVANLIHTSSVLNKSYFKVGSGSKVMKPVSVEDPIAETGHLVTDGPGEYRNRSYPAREYRNRSRNYSRACILKGDRTVIYEDHESPSRQSRYSWTSAPDDMSTNFRKSSVSSSSCSGGTIPSLSDKNFSTGSKSSLQYSPSRNDRNPSSIYYPPVVQHYSAGHSPQLNSDSVSEQSTSFGRSLSRRSSNAPPPPPRRSPSTKLTKSSQNRKESVSSSEFHSSSDSSRKGSNQSTTAPAEHLFINREYETDLNESFAEDELPELPPRLPLYDPSSHHLQSLQSGVNPNFIDLPVPPPPPPSQAQFIPGNQPCVDQTLNGETPDYDFPPPPPPPLL